MDKRAPCMPKTFQRKTLSEHDIWRMCLPFLIASRYKITLFDSVGIAPSPLIHL